MSWLNAIKLNLELMHGLYQKPLYCMTHWYSCMVFCHSRLTSSLLSLLLCDFINPCSPKLQPLSQWRGLCLPTCPDLRDDLLIFIAASTLFSQNGTSECAQCKMDLWHCVYDLMGQSDPVWLCFTVIHPSPFVVILCSVANEGFHTLFRRNKIGNVMFNATLRYVCGDSKQIYKPLG